MSNHTESAHVNSSSEVFYYPSLTEYYSQISPFILSTILISWLLFMVNLAIFKKTIEKIEETLVANNKSLKIYSKTAASLYVIISLAALTTVMIPQSWLICHTVMHFCFLAGAAFIHRIAFIHVDGESNFIRTTGDLEVVNLKTPPMCCCCLCLPTFSPTKTSLFAVKYMIYQMLLVQGSLMMILNVFYFNDRENFQVVSKYVLPFIIASIVLGIWGMNICVRMINGIVMESKMMMKMLCVQIILILCKAQYLVLHSYVLDLVSLGSIATHGINKNAIVNLVILIEMVPASFLVRKAFS